MGGQQVVMEGGQQVIMEGGQQVVMEGQHVVVTPEGHQVIMEGQQVVMTQDGRPVIMTQEEVQHQLQLQQIYQPQEGAGVVVEHNVQGAQQDNRLLQLCAQLASQEYITSGVPATVTRM